MTTIDIVLKNNNLEKYIPIFKENNIDVDIAKYIDVNMMKNDLNITSLGDRIRLKNIFAKLDTSKTVDKKDNSINDYSQKQNMELDCYKLSIPFHEKDCNDVELYYKYKNPP